MEKRKITSVEKSVQRVLFYRYLRGGLAALTVLLILGVAFVFWTKHRYQAEHVDAANYDRLDESSPTYWMDRVDLDIESIKSLSLPPPQEVNRLRSRLRRTLQAAAATPPGFGRSVAISDTALAVFRHDINVNAEEFLESMGETPLAMALRAKALVANALMLLRLNDQVAAAVAMNTYDRIVNSADIKLDTEAAELAFYGAAKVYRYTFDTASLDALFQRNLKFASRIGEDDLRMKAYRIIATAQAAANRDRDAMETAAMIKNPIEAVRAYQGVVVNVARPEKPDLTEPEFFLPKVEGPWVPISQPKNAKRVINDVLHQIASRETISDQVDLLMRLAGSRMVCDPDLHTLFKSCLLESESIDEIAKKPVLQLLLNPESPTIRKALSLPETARQKSTDTALDNWTSTTEEVSVDIGAVDPSIIKGIVNFERIRIQLAVARSYLSVNRRQDAALSLRQTLPFAQALPNVRDEIDFLLDIAGLQIVAGDFVGTRNTFTAIGLPKRVDGVLTWESPGSDPTAEFSGESMEPSLVRLGRLQVLARFLEDAELTMNMLPPGETKDEENAFLAAELIRVQRLREATRLIIGMTPGPRQTELLQRLEIAKGGTEENDRNLTTASPEKAMQDDALVDATVSLIRLGLYDAAREAAKRISNPESRAAQSLRIIRDLLLFFGAYGSEEREHQAVRQTLLDIALRTANDIEPPQDHATALEMILSAAIPFAKEKEEQESLLKIVSQALEIARKIPAAVPAKAVVVPRLLSCRILLYSLVNNRSTSWPSLSKEQDKPLIDEIMETLSHIVGILNDIEDDNTHARGRLAIARVFGQIGRANHTRQILDGVREIAKSQSDKRISVSLFLGTIPLFRALDDPEAAISVYFDAFSVVGNVPNIDPTGGNAGMIFGVRLRDSEIDRLARSLLENDFMPEAILFAGRIQDDMMKDRLLKIAVFRFIDKENFTEAESAVRRITNPDDQTFLRRCTEFVKRQKGASVP